jgi:hypothetical protein
MESKGYREITGKTAVGGFDAITLVGGGRRVQVLAAQFCPTGTAFCLTQDAYQIHALGGLPSTIGGDGLKLLRKASANDYEIRAQMYPAASAIPAKIGRVAV